MSYPENINATDFKTRVLIYSDSPAHSAFIHQILDLNEKAADYVGTVQEISADSDFLVMSTSDSAHAVEFRPTIVFMSSESGVDGVMQIISQITPGGVLVYPESFEETIQNSTNYFRKLPFAPANINAEAGEYYLTTDMGDLPLNKVEVNVHQDLEGIKLFCAQFGVMEEEFYSTISEL